MIDTGSETQLSVLKVMAVSTLFYANEWWVHKMMDLSHIEAKNMKFLRGTEIQKDSA
jgi:hypothetical protein